LLADDQGAHGRARQLLDAALRADPHNVNLRWEAALLALRCRTETWRWSTSGTCSRLDPGQRDAAFQLARTLLSS